MSEAREDIADSIANLIARTRAAEAAAWEQDGALGAQLERAAEKLTAALAELRYPDVDEWVCDCGFVGSVAGRHLHNEVTHETRAP